MLRALAHVDRDLAADPGDRGLLTGRLLGTVGGAGVMAQLCNRTPKGDSQLTIAFARPVPSVPMRQRFNPPGRLSSPLASPASAIPR